MTAFSVTPLTDVPPPAAQEFPNFIQMQAAGTDLGGPDADTLNFGAGLTATRGTGENSNVVSVTGEAATSSLQVQEDGVNLGEADVDTINFSTGITATRGSDRTVTVNVPAPSSAITWREVSGSTEVAVGDLGNGIDASSELDGTITITIPPDTDGPFTNDPVLIFMGGTRAVEVAAGVGVTLLVRSAFSGLLAGQYATATLLRRESDVWILCGDLEAA